MQFYSFGMCENPIIILLPGTFCHWENNFGHVLPLLEQDYYVICVSYDGFDDKETSEFQDIMKEVEKIENYVKEHLEGHVHSMYGCSLGGSLVGLLVERNQISIDHAILGSSDLDQEHGVKAKILSHIAVAMMYKAIRSGKTPKWIARRWEKQGGKEHAANGGKMVFGEGGIYLSNVSKRSMWNQFYSDLITPLGYDIQQEGTQIHCFYAKKMGEKYKERYLKHFKNPDILEFDLGHEELLCDRPVQWVKAIRECAEK